MSDGGAVPRRGSKDNPSKTEREYCLCAPVRCRLDAVIVSYGREPYWSTGKFAGFDEYLPVQRACDRARKVALVIAALIVIAAATSTAPPFSSETSELPRRRAVADAPPFVDTSPRQLRPVLVPGVTLGNTIEPP